MELVVDLTKNSWVEINCYLAFLGEPQKNSFRHQEFNSVSFLSLSFLLYSGEGWSERSKKIIVDNKACEYPVCSEKVVGGGGGGDSKKFIKKK